MTSSLEHRLKSWEAVINSGGPAWLIEFAPQAIREIKAIIAAQGIETRSATDAKRRGPKGESPVRDSECAKTLSGGGK